MLRDYNNFSISIHAPTRGATDKNEYDRDKLYISIHAPTRGATDDLTKRMEKIEFQSTLPREERQAMEDMHEWFIEFQSTLPREERRFTPEDLQRSHYFNPRSHERSDVLCEQVYSVSTISIHAPTRGATLSSILYQRDIKFQSTLPREERRCDEGISRGDKHNFNPRSHERSDEKTP